jgi:hypothetical protein
MHAVLVSVGHFLALLIVIQPKHLKHNVWRALHTTNRGAARSSNVCAHSNLFACRLKIAGHLTLWGKE